MCIFCNLDTKKVVNTIIDETDNFYILPALGSLVEGYLLIVTKRHINSMSDLSKNEIIEYLEIIDRYRENFYKVYGRYPIVFEHGTPKIHSKIKASSVTHAHTHIINHNYLVEDELIKKLEFKKINSIGDINNQKNYISYINPMGVNMVSYTFSPESQLMRRMIAKDLGIDEKFSWKEYSFMENVELTIDKFK